MSRDGGHQGVSCEGGACHLEVAPRSVTAINVCQKDFPTVLTCADSHKQPENENVCASFQPLEWLRPTNLTVVQSYLNTAVRIKKAEVTFFFNVLSTVQC